jgi:aminopeptidase C
MTHAMTFTAVDLDEDGNVDKLRVENSWGEKDGDKGYLSMVRMCECMCRVHLYTWSIIESLLMHCTYVHLLPIP